MLGAGSLGTNTRKLEQRPEPHIDDNYLLQVVWADTEAVGCGVKLCPQIWIKPRNEWWYDAYYVVCDYGPR